MQRLQRRSFVCMMQRQVCRTLTSRRCLVSGAACAVAHSFVSWRRRQTQKLIWPVQSEFNSLSRALNQHQTATLRGIIALRSRREWSSSGRACRYPGVAHTSMCILYTVLVHCSFNDSAGIDLCIRCLAELPLRQTLLISSEGACR